jgi:hypothetical protein
MLGGLSEFLLIGGFPEALVFGKRLLCPKRVSSALSGAGENIFFANFA